MQKIHAFNRTIKCCFEGPANSTASYQKHKVYLNWKGFATISYTLKEFSELNGLSETGSFPGFVFGKNKNKLNKENKKRGEKKKIFL